MRGIVTGGMEAEMQADNSNAEHTGADRIDLTSTGFKLKTTSPIYNGDGDTYIFMCLRRSDGYVGKPVELGSDCFQMDTGNSSATIPAIDSGFPVDFALLKGPTTAGYDWYTGSRLIGSNYLWTNSDAAQASSSNLVWDSNTGYYKNIPSSGQGWMFKRHAGLDVVAYEGDGVAGREISHSLNKTIEMMWIKNRSNSRVWAVYHKDLGGSDPAYAFWLELQDDAAQQPASYSSGDTGQFYRDPTATHFSVNGPHNKVNADGDNYIAMLFSSVPTISAVGSYTGNGSARTIDFPDGGFTPRFMIIKNASGGGNWFVYDTLRGWPTSGNASYLFMDTNAAQQGGTNYINPTSTGFSLPGSAMNSSSGGGAKYVYYAHA
jgi:hypothetical protein